MTYLLGAKAVKRLAIDADPFAFYHAKLTSALFKGEQEQAIFAFTKNFFEKFQTVPSVETLEATFPEMKELSVPEPHKYYIAQLETRFGYDVIDAATKAARETLKGDGTNINGAEGKLRDALGTLTAQRYRNKILDMGTEAPGLLLSNYHGSLSGDTPAYFGWPYMDLKGGVKPTEIASFVGRPASGKAQPLDAKVLTVSGFKRMGDIQVGDVLASVDGEQSKVESVHPQGKKPVYKFTFSDGRSTEAAEDHLCY